MFRTLLVTDASQSFEIPTDTWVVNWNDGQAPAGQVSAVQLVEPLSEKLRAEYLNWSYNLGLTAVAGRSLREQFEAPELGCSLWWFSLFSEKSKYKSKLILKTLKLRAIEEAILTHSIRELRYDGADADIDLILKNLAQEYSLTYRPSPKPQLAGGRTLQILRAFYVLGSVFLKKFLPMRFLFRSSSLAEWCSSSIIGVTYFPNLDTEALKKDKYRSAYWGPLHDTTKTDGARINWIAITPGLDPGGILASIRTMNQINDSSAEQSNRVVPLEYFLNVSSFFSAFRVYLRGLGKSRELWGKIKFPSYPNSRIDLSPLMAHDWKESFEGSASIQNILFSLAFNRIMSRFVRPRLALYLMEGQAWERAFVNACHRSRSKSHPCRTVGVQHSALRLMDFRMFHDPRAFDPSTPVNDLLPDWIAPNGDGAKNHLIRGGVPTQRLIETEALRYTYLAGRFGSRKQPLPQNARTLLVVLDYLDTESRFQMELLVDAQKYPALRLYEKIIVKPHPCTSLETVMGGLELPKNLRIENTLPLSALWDTTHVVYSSNITSAAIEAAWMGLPVISARSSDDLNLSPFFGLPDYPFPQDANELAALLQDPPTPEISSDYFHVDVQLPRWRSLLNQ